MKCSKVRKKAFLYFENKLPVEEKEKIQKHLKDCAWCMADYKKTEKMMSALRGGSPKIIPDNLHSNIMLEVNGMKSFNEEEKKETRLAITRGIRRAGVVFAAVFVVCFTLQFVDFKTISEKGFEGLMDITESATTAIEESKLENTRDEDKIDTLGDVFSMAAGNLSGSTSSSSTSAVSEEVKNGNIDMTVREESADKESSEIEVDDEEIDESLGNVNGFASPDDYAELLDGTDISKKAAVKIYVSNFDDTVKEIKDITKKANGNIYYQNIYLAGNKNDSNISDDEEYRTAIIAIKVKETKYEELKEKVETLGKYDVNVEQDTPDDNSAEELQVLLLKCQNDKLTLTETLNETEDEIEIQNINMQIDALNESITNLEAQLSLKGDTENIVKLEITLKECSELDIEGIISGKTYMSNIKKSFNNGCVKFVRFMQDVFLWICNNILFIILYFALFIIVYMILKSIFLRDKD